MLKVVVKSTAWTTEKNTYNIVVRLACLHTITSNITGDLVCKMCLKSFVMFSDVSHEL